MALRRRRAGPASTPRSGGSSTPRISRQAAASHSNGTSWATTWSAWHPTNSTDLRLAQAVAASAAVPGVLAPMKIRGIRVPVRPARRTELLDGGTYDNTGLEALNGERYRDVFLHLDQRWRSLRDEDHPRTPDRPRLARLRTACCTDRARACARYGWSSGSRPGTTACLCATRTSTPGGCPVRPGHHGDCVRVGVGPSARAFTSSPTLTPNSERSEARTSPSFRRSSTGLTAICWMPWCIGVGG